MFSLIGGHQIKKKQEDGNKKKTFIIAIKSISQKYIRNIQKAKKRLEFSDYSDANRENWTKKVSL